MSVPWKLNAWILDDAPGPVLSVCPDVVPMRRYRSSDEFFWVSPCDLGKVRADAPLALLAVEDAADHLLDEGDVGGDAEGGDDIEDDIKHLLDEVSDIKAHEFDDDVHEDIVTDHPRLAADITVHTEHGSISYYARYKRFEAVCGNEAHKRGHTRCVLTRSSDRYMKTAACGTVVGGRPLGLMLAWLRRCNCATQGDHVNELAEVERDFEERKQARIDLGSFDDFLALHACERQELHDNELPLEPLHVKP
jgi:hypothetical protein